MGTLREERIWDLSSSPRVFRRSPCMFQLDRGLKHVVTKFLIASNDQEQAARGNVYVRVY